MDAAAADWTQVKLFGRIELGLSLLTVSLVLMCSPGIGEYGLRVIVILSVLISVPWRG